MLVEIFIDLQSPSLLSEVDSLAKALATFKDEQRIKLIYKPYSYLALFKNDNFDKYAFCLLKLASYENKGFKFIRLYKTIDNFTKEGLIELALNLNLDFAEVDQALNTHCFLNDLDLDLEDALNLNVQENLLHIEKNILPLKNQSIEKITIFINDVYNSKPRKDVKKTKGEYCADCCPRRKK